MSEWGNPLRQTRSTESEHSSVGEHPYQSLQSKRGTGQPRTELCSGSGRTQGSKTFQYLEEKKTNAYAIAND